MTDRPIIFSGPMVRALIEGRKTQTRRLAWQSDPDPQADDWPTIWQRVKPGDRLWVRETWDDPAGERRPIYRADLSPEQQDESDRINRICRGLKGIASPWRPSIHMPRWASRLTLVVTSTRIERLQDISDEDAEAEGCQGYWSHLDNRFILARENFGDLWDSLHGATPNANWDANPEVVALSFTAHLSNIDAMERAA